MLQANGSKWATDKGVCVQMVEGLHAKRVFLGAVQPERILVKPSFCLAECCPGTSKPIALQMFAAACAVHV